MEMDNELKKFIQQQKARVAEDTKSTLPGNKELNSVDQSYLANCSNLLRRIALWYIDCLQEIISEQSEMLCKLLQFSDLWLDQQTKDHKTYDHTLKENIPPFKSFTAQGKEESCCLSLPLGKDYERKKQKLHQELRLDYRHFMAQEQIAFLRAPPDLPDVHCSPRPPVHPKRVPSRRETAMLTEGKRGLHRGGHFLVEGSRMEGLRPEDELLLPREARLVRVDYDSEEDLTEEDLDLIERRRLRQTGSERAEERRRLRRHYKTDFRDISRLRDRRVELPDDYTETSHYADRKETNGSVVPDEDYLEARWGTSSLTPKAKLQVPAGMRPNGRSRSSTKKDEPEFATGLMIGAADADAALQRRKERYRQELQEQIAEQQRNKKREKDLELRVAVTGLTDLEKQADWIKPLGAVNGGDHARKRKDSFYPPGQAVDVPGDELNRKPSEENRERLPPEQPRMAFQSPLLEYSHALGLSSRGISPYSQAIHRSMDTPRIPGFFPHPPSTLADAHRSPYDKVYLYHGARNPLDPNLANYGQIPLTGGGQPVSYLSLPPAGPHPSQTQHSPPSQHRGSSHPEPPPHRPASDAAFLGSGIGGFPAEQIKPSKQCVLSYKEALRQQGDTRKGRSQLFCQIQDRQERRRLDREERDRYEAKLEADMKNHDPWGRGGGGAPLRDSRGNLITDLHQMHKHNEEAYINPETWQKMATATVTVLREEDTRPPSTHRVSGFVQAPLFARGSVFGNRPTPQQVHEQDKHKAYLKQQIEEKRKKEAEERESQRLEEEKEEKRLAEQRERIQREYEEEQDRKKRKEMEQKAKNEQLIRLAEERKKEVERKKKEAEEKENSALRKQYEKERQARLEEVPREPSPPIPTLQKRYQAPQYTPRPPSMDSRRSTAVSLSERSLSGLQSPPVPARWNQLRAADQRGVISELSVLRRQLRSEQKRLEVQLLQSEWEELDSPMSDRLRDRERPQVDVFDMARLQLQAPVRRPSSRNTEPNYLHRIHDSLQLRYRDVDSREEEGHGYCEPPRDRAGQRVDIQRRADYRVQQRRINSLREPVDDCFDLSPPQQQNHYLRNAVGDHMKGSLLESDSAFIDPMGEAFPVPPTPEPQLSARERRRLAKRADLHNERVCSREPVGQPETYSHQSEASLNTEQHGRRHNHHRTKRLPAMSHYGLGTADLSSDEDASPQVSPRAPEPRGSVDMVAMEPWIRPGTSETLKRLMTGQTPRRERLTSRESAIQD